MKNWFVNHPMVGMMFLLFIVNVLLVFPAFLVNLDTLSSWDESAYIHGGMILIEKGIWPSVADSPLVSLVFGLIYLPFRTSALWLVQSAIVGRILLFTLLWFSVMLIARQLKSYTSMWVVMGLFLVARFTTAILVFPSDPLFVGLAALGFWQVLIFYNGGGSSHLAAASAFLGFSALARNDGLLLFGIFLFLALFLAFTAPERKSIRQRVIKPMVAALAPFLIIVGCSVLVTGIQTGNFSLGTMARTYDNFESGHLSIYGGEGAINQSYEAQQEARRIFGTPTENNYSVFTAIRQNPQVYLQRLATFSKTLPARALRPYGIRQTVILFLFVLRGIVLLFQHRDYRLLAICFLWPSFLASAFMITLLRDGHMLFSFYVVLALAAIGVTAMLSDLEDRLGQIVWLGGLSAITIASFAANKLAIYYGAIVLLIGVIVILVLRSRINDYRPFALLVLLCVGIILRDGFPGPSAFYIGYGPKAEAVIYLTKHFPPDTPIAAGSPGVPWAAKMTYAGLGGLDVPRDRSPEEFVEWMRAQNIRAVFIDPAIYQDNPVIWDLLQTELGVGLERVFSAGNGDIQILVVK